MKRLALLTAVSLACAAPAFAQHEGHPMPQQSAPPAQQPAVVPENHGDHAMPPGKKVEGPQPMTMDAVDPPEAGNDIPPDAPVDHAADAFFPKADMERARRILDEEHGGALVSKFMLNELEYMGGDNVDGYRWDGQAWFGGDIDRLVLKSKGEGVHKLESAEVQALYSRAVGPYTDVQVGVRYDIEPNPSRTYLAVGFESLMPYWFDVEGGLFFGNRGQVLGRIKGSTDFMLTQRLVLQPAGELNFAAKDDMAIGLGSGFTDAEVGLRLRYEIHREFAPYVGVLWERKLGSTADIARAAGEGPESTRFVAGLRAWF
mgnify:FL=1